MNGRKVNKLASSGNNQNNTSGLDFLKTASRYVKNGVVNYVKDSMPTSTSAIEDAGSSLKQFTSTMRTTSSDIMSRTRQLKNQVNMRSLMNWFMDKEDQYDSDVPDVGNEWDDGTDDSTFEAAQISETKASANQISSAVIESIHKSVEANIQTTANIISALDNQSATIASGFKQTGETLNKILDVLTKNSAALIEIEATKQSASEKMLSDGKFSIAGLKDVIKGNTGEASVIFSVASAMMSAMSAGGGLKPAQLIEMGISGAMNKFAPKVGKNLNALDEAVNDVLMGSLIRLGNSKYNGGLKGILGSIFGIDSSRKEIDTSRDELKLKSTPFDTVTKEAITNAIPGYLRKILVAVGGPDVVYDYRSRDFKTQQAIVKDFRNAATKHSTGTLYRANENVRKTLGDDEWTSMVYDLLVNYVGTQSGYNEANEIIDNLKDPRFVESLINNELIGRKGKKYDRANSKVFAKRMASINDEILYNTILEQASGINVKRNIGLQDYVKNANALGMDLSGIKDDHSKDADSIKGKYRRNDITKPESSITEKVDSGKLTGVDYTNLALYEIYRRLDTGINVFQVGSSNDQKKKYTRWGSKHLKKPTRGDVAKDEPNTDESGQSFIGGSGDDYNNPLKNGVDADGNPENLSKGERFKRWGVTRGKQLGGAILHGSPDEVKQVFSDTIHDVSQVASDQFKKGVSKINDHFGNVGGYLKHKMFGTGYEYTDEKGKQVKIADNKKGGVFGFVTDKVKGMFDIGKDKAKNWFSDVAGYFDYGDDKESSQETVAKRKKLLHASVGAMAGAGILGGPVGLIMGAVAGNALGQVPNIGQKLKEKLFGKDKETGKPTGLINRAADAVISPIQYQMSKTMSYVGDRLKKNILGPLSDLGYVMKERAAKGVHSVVTKVFGKIFDLGAKAMGGLAKIGGKIFEGIVGFKGEKARRKFGIVSGIAGGVMNATNWLMAGDKEIREGLSDRKKKRNNEIKENSTKYEKYSEWKKNKWARNKDVDFSSYLTEEQIKVSEKTEENTSEVADNTKQTVETLEDIKEEIRDMRKDKSDRSSDNKSDTVSSGESEVATGGNVIPFTEQVRRDKEDNSDFGERLMSGATTVAAMGGIDDGEIQDMSELATAADKGESKTSLFGRFKKLMKKNKDNTEKTEEKQEESFISKLIGGIGSVFSKYWPYLLGGLALLSEDFRGILKDVGSWLITEVLPGALSFLGGVAEKANTAIEANAFGADYTVDPVTGEAKAVVSSETQIDHYKNGIWKSGFESAIDPLRLAKQTVVAGAGRAGMRLTGSLVTGIGRAIQGSGIAANFGSRALQTIAQTGSYVSQYGLKGSLTAAREIFKGTASTLGNTAASGGSKVAGIGTGLKTANMKLKDALFKPSTWGKVGANVLGTAVATISHDTVWNVIDDAKNNRYSGDYGMGINAGGYAMTNTTVKTWSSLGAGVAGGVAAGAILAAKTSILSALGFATTGVGSVVSIVLIIIAAAALIGAAIAAIVNFVTGIVTDSADEDYSIRSNASKMQGAIDGRIQYNNGKQNPMYVYCGRDSDRVLGLNKGVFIKDADIVFGRYFHTVIEGLSSSPGAEVLLYDWINNMAVQGVPFACYVAGDSHEAKAKGKQCNTDTTGIPPTERSGPLGGTYTRVKKSTVEKNINAIFNDIATNINRQNPEYIFTPDDVKEIYNGGKEVVEALQAEGILDGKGKVKTSAFKKGLKSSKPSSGWKSLETLCRKNGMYFLMKCLLYINSKVEATKEGEQWLEVKKTELEELIDAVQDVAKEEKQELVDELKSQGMSDEEIESYLKSASDPKGNQATESAELSEAESAIASSLSESIPEKDKSDVIKELKYLAAGYAYSHPSYLQHWIAENRDKVEMNDDSLSQVAKWSHAFNNDSRMKQALRGEMRNAALAYGEVAGDIFNLLPQFNWEKIASHKKIDEYGAGFVIRGQESEPGGGILDDIFENPNKDYSPDEVHDELFGRISHGRGAEAESASDQDWTIHGNGVIARIAEKITDYPSESGIAMTEGESGDDWRNVLLNMPAYSPPMRPAVDESIGNSSSARDLMIQRLRANGTSAAENDNAIGGPMDVVNDAISKAVSVVSLNGEGTYPDEGASEVAEDGEQVPESGGNPLINKGYRITSGFGATANRPHSGAHNGVDLVPLDGSGNAEVGARFSGTIVDVKRDIPDSIRAQKVNGSWQFPYSKDLSTGNMVSIKTDDGMIVKNMHLKAGSIPSNIQPGQRVNPGERIGTMGSTGWSTGNHLHYEFRDSSNNPLDPTESLSNPSSWKSGAEEATYDGSGSSNSYTSSLGSYASNFESGSTEENGGWLSTLISKLKDVGNNFLSSITGGLLGSSSSSDNESIASAGTYGSSGSYGATNASYLTGNCNNEWITIVRDVKKLVADQRPSYSQTTYIPITYKGKTLKVRTDCSGIVCAMLKYYGVMGDNDNMNSSMMMAQGAIKDKFDRASWPGWENLVEGDILTSNGHVEIFATNKDGRHYVYNGGDTGPLCSPGATPSTHSQYPIIWRCREEVQTMTLGDGANITADSKDIWNYLKSQNLNNYAVAGLMGNLYAESGLRTNNLQDSYESKLGSDDEYTAKVNSGEYTNFAGDSAGYGLAQWTSSGRKAGLYQLAKESGKAINDPEVQLNHLMNELNSSYKGSVLGPISAASSVKEASDVVLHKFESPTDQSSAVEAKRAGYAQSFYDQFADGNDSSSIVDPMANTDGGVGGPDETMNALESMISFNGDGSISNSNYRKPTRKYNVYKPSDTTSSFGTTRPRTSSTDSTPSNDITVDNTEIVNLLKDVLTELRTINGNTGTSNNLLKAIGDNGIADKDLRNQLSSINGSTRSSSNTTTSYRKPNSTSNNRLVSSMIRPV